MTDDPRLATRAAQRWAARRTFGPDRLPNLRDLAERKRADGISVSVALPALNEAETVGPICEAIGARLMGTLVDELVVLDGGSDDDTAARARAAGAGVVDARALLPETPFAGGKGDALWRGLSVLEGDLVVWIDADIRNFEPHFVSRLIAPLLCDPTIQFTKAFYRRPLSNGGTLEPHGGGRVTELLARPLLDALFPELSAVRQPLSGEYAGRRALLERMPFFSGYSVEVGLLIDILSAEGLDAIAQVDLDERVHRNRPLEELAPMAHAIARTILARAQERSRLSHPSTAAPLELERPPLASLDDAEAHG